MGKKGGLDSDAVLNIVMIIAVSVMILWYLNIRVSFDELKKNGENLATLQDAINLACAYDHMVLDSIVLYSLNGNLTITEQDVCIESSSSADMCISVVCPAIAGQQFNLDEKHIFQITKTSGGYELA